MTISGGTLLLSINPAIVGLSCLIYFGLFQAGKGRAFLNVVDIKGDVLNDITLSMAERQAKLAAEESQALKRRPVETPVRETPKQGKHTHTCTHARRHTRTHTHT